MDWHLVSLRIQLVLLGIGDENWGWNFHGQPREQTPMQTRHWNWQGLHECHRLCCCLRVLLSSNLLLDRDDHGHHGHHVLRDYFSHGRDVLPRDFRLVCSAIAVAGSDFVAVVDHLEPRILPGIWAEHVRLGLWEWLRLED